MPTPHPAPHPTPLAARSILPIILAVGRCMLPASSGMGQTPAALSGMRFSATRPFGNLVSLETATIAAEAAARNMATQAVIRFLVTRPEVRLASRSSDSPDLLALAHAVAPPSVLFISQSRRASSVTVTVTLAATETLPMDSLSLDARIRDALIHPERLPLYAYAARRERDLVEALESLLHKADAPSPGMKPDVTEDLMRNLGNDISALALYRQILPRLDGIWREPATLLEAIRPVIALSPGNPLSHNAYGDACLQLGRSQEALEAQTRALALDPAFTRAYHSRCLAYMTLHLPTLAASDCSRAVEQDPRVAAYYRDRGLAYLMLDETPALCRDFYTACTLGDCEKFTWATSGGRCDP